MDVLLTNTFSKIDTPRQVIRTFSNHWIWPIYEVIANGTRSLNPCSVRYHGSIKRH